MDDENTSSLDASPVVEFRGLALANVGMTLLLLGAVAALYGPLLLTFSTKFHVSLPRAGLVLSIHFLGALVGVPLGWLALRRWRGQLVVAATLAVFALGALDVAVASSWGLLLAGVFAVGLGFGGADFALNSLMARTRLEGRARRLSLANAGYGVGAVVGPLLVIAARPKDFAVLFSGAAIVAVALATLNRGVIAPTLTQRHRAHDRQFLHPRRRAILITFIVAYVLYVATESSASGWIASQLHREGFSTSLGSLVTGGFWLGLALGRLVGSPLYHRFSDKALVLGGLALAVVVGLIAEAHSLAPFAYPVLGVVLASVYPMGLIWYTVLCPRDGDGLALIILFMMAGGIIGPGAESLFVGAIGIHAVPVVIAVFAAFDLAAFASALRFRRLNSIPLGA